MRVVHGFTALHDFVRQVYAPDGSNQPTTVWAGMLHRKKLPNSPLVPVTPTATVWRLRLMHGTRLRDPGAKGERDHKNATHCDTASLAKRHAVPLEGRLLSSLPRGRRLIWQM